MDGTVTLFNRWRKQGSVGLSALLSHVSAKTQGKEPRSTAPGLLLLAPCLAAQCLLRPWCICTPKQSHTLILTSFLCTSNPDHYAFTMFYQPFSIICPTSSHISQAWGLDFAFYRKHIFRLHRCLLSNFSLNDNFMYPSALYLKKSENNQFYDEENG